MFATLAHEMSGERETALRWRLTDEEEPQGRLFDERGWIPGRDELAGLELLHVRARSVLNRVPEGARVPFRWTVNPYRGCSHACVYCFARPTHEYVGLGPGDDFERRIVVKVNAPEVAARELAAPRWRGEHVALGTNTDPYQPVEGRYRLTRGVIEALVAAGNPFSVLTKSPLLLRDLDLLASAAEQGLVETALSIPTVDRAAWRRTEPHAPAPRARLDAVARLNAAGIPCGVLVAPVIPGVTDDERGLEEVVRGALAAGAVSVSAILLHLRPGVREHYLEWLGRDDPDLARATAARYRGPYAPALDRARVARRVADLVERHGGTRPRPRPGRRFAAPGAEAAPPAAQRQLRLVAPPPPGA
jgi:DNA repair photolyase